MQSQQKKSTVGLLALLLVIGLAICFFSWQTINSQAAPLAPEDWPMYQHDPSHSGRTSATITNTTPLYVQWAYSFGERVEAEVQPVVVDGVVYVGVMNGNMNAIDASTGTTIWSMCPGGPIAHTAAVANNQVIYGSLDGFVYALSTTNGEVNWQYETGGPVVSAPTIVNDIVYIGSNDGNLYALNASDGQEIWHAETGGPVISSPAVNNNRVYFGSEDLYARAVNTDTGEEVWKRQLYGAGMHNTHPIISDDGQTVVFTTVKPGVSSYVPVEGYPNAAEDADPLETWNTYYQEHPTYRSLYYLDAATGEDLWEPAQQRYIPLPISYWGLLSPVLHPDGTLWFPAPAGTYGNAYTSNHDNRLFSINLTTGETTQQAQGSEFQHRSDENGRAIFSGEDYYTTISEDVGVFRTSNMTHQAVFSNGTPGSYNFGSHAEPHSPLPSRHLWRYGGIKAMGGVPGASPAVIANQKLYFISYGWLYALGTSNQGNNPATDFPSSDQRAFELTYPRSSAPDETIIAAEIDQRVNDILALGPENPPITARWEQAASNAAGMSNNEFRLEVYGYEADLVRVLAEAYPHVSIERQDQVRAYLQTFIDNTLLVPDYYTNNTMRCIVYGEPGIQEGNENCTSSGKIIASWASRNPNLVGMRLYALWAYADATEDWARIEDNWMMIWAIFEDNFLNESFCNPSPMGFCMYESWRVGRLNIGAQIEAAQAVRDMANHLGQTIAQEQAQQFLDQVLAARLQMANFVPQLYTSEQRQPYPIRLNNEVPECDPCDERIHHADLFEGTHSFSIELIPYQAEMRDATNDPSQLNWWYSDTNYQVDAATGYMYYQALSGYFPLSTSLANLLNSQLYTQTVQYIQSYEVNAPWWWMSDLAHHTTCGGEHLYHSPTLAWTIFQTKARVLKLDWNTLVHQLPEPMSFNARYDLYRLQNLATLLDMIPGAPGEPDLSESAKNANTAQAQDGDIITYTITIRNTGDPLTDTLVMTDTLPSGLSYVPGSLSTSPALGSTDDSAAPELRWSGEPGATENMIITYQAIVNTSAAVDPSLTNTATITSPSTGILKRSYTVIISERSIYLPLIIRE